MIFLVWALIGAMAFHAVAVESALASDSALPALRSVDEVAAKQPTNAGEPDFKRSPRPRPSAAASTSGAAQSAQCRWLGTRIVSLLSRDDAMTAKDFNPFYERFGCPRSHLSEAFGCVVGGGGQAQGEELASRVDRCWADPVRGLRPQELWGDAEMGDDGGERPAGGT